MTTAFRSPPAVCSTCQQDPKQRFGLFGECSHIDCPIRRRAWSDGTGAAVRALKPVDHPLDVLFDSTEE